MNSLVNSPETTSEEFLELKDISLVYRSGKENIQALDAFNLSIKKGEFITILGASGCGKSTLLGLIAGFQKPTSGNIRLDGTTVTKPDRDRGVVFQHAALYPWLSVRSNIAFGLQMRGVAAEERDRIVNHNLKRVRLDEYAELRPYECSGGMKQRVSIARVIANEPKIILMDEPFGALDAMTREEMQNLIRHIWFETGTTVILVTHDIDEALLLGTRTLVLSPRPGHIIKEFRTDFSVRAQSDFPDSIRHSQEFLRIRNEISQLIHGNPITFTI